MGLKVYHCNEWHNEFTEFYRKDEVKKVIKELKAQKAQAEDDCAYWKTKAQRERHHKYKRCLAMAMWCRIHDEITQLESERLGLSQRALFIEYRRKAMWWNKWHKRWLELAEKFKPNNSTAQ